MLGRGNVAGLTPCEAICVKFKPTIKPTDWPKRQRKVNYSVLSKAKTHSGSLRQRSNLITSGSVNRRSRVYIFYRAAADFSIF